VQNAENGSCRILIECTNAVGAIIAGTRSTIGSRRVEPLKHGLAPLTGKGQRVLRRVILEGKREAARGHIDQ
jgi:hypothetical protein